MRICFCKHRTENDMKSENITREQLCAMFDHTNLKPYAVKNDFEKLCAEASANNFAMVAVNSVQTAVCKEFLKGTSVHVGAAIGFPLGQVSMEVKIFETKVAIADGADEIDYVINIGEAKEGNWDYIRNEMKEMVGVPVLHHDIFTNGIEYFRCFFDVKDLEEYTPYLSLLSELISAMDTEKYTKLELSNEILLHAGGISTDLVVYANRHNDDYRFLWEISGKALTGETEKVFDLLAEMLTNTKLFDEKRLYEIIAESRSIKQSSLLSAGHTTAVGRAMAYMKKNAYLTEYIRGIAYYDFLCDLEEHFDERKENLISVLQALAKKVFVKERLSVDLTSGKEGLKPLENGLSRLIDRLPDSVEEKLLKPEYSMKPIVGNEGFKTAGKVQYVARVGNSSEKGIAYNGVNKVLKTILGYDYLWNEVRVKGGAYGVMCAFTDMGNGYMVSYRDPNLAETNEVFEKVPDYLESFDADERDMMKYIIGTVSELDTPLTPRAEGRRSSQAWLTDITFEQIQKERDEVLSADCEQVREAAKMVSTVLSDGYICAIGSEGKVEDAKELFNEIRVLN